jgi:hypothetical protein
MTSIRGILSIGSGDRLSSVTTWNQENEQGVPYNRYQPPCRRSLFVASWLHPRFIAGRRW